MKLSTHKHLIFKDRLTKEDKPLIMRQCVKHFTRHNVDTLEELYELVADNVVYAPIYWRRNHRKISNAYLEKIDLLVYDSDDGDTKDEIIEMLGHQEVMVIETSGWTPEKEKYRIFIPLAKPITFESPEEYTAFYRWVGDNIGLNYDSSTTECGRGYIGLKDKAGFMIEGERFDPSKDWELEKYRFQKKQARIKLKSYIRSLNLSEYREDNGFKVPTPYELYYNDKKFNEIASDCRAGNNYKTVFKLLGYCKFRGLDASSSAEAVMMLNLGREYNNKKELQKRYEKLQ